MQEQTQESKKVEVPKFKIFGKYSVEDVEIKDPGIRCALNLDAKLSLKSQGRNVKKHGQVDINIIERLVNRLIVAGHRGKKHKIELGHTTGKFEKYTKMVLKVFENIEKKTNKNPIQVLITAIENSAPRNETTMIEYGGARYPQAVDSSPLRRINLALRHLVHGASDKAFNKKETIAETLTGELILASENNGESLAIKKKNEAEKQADSAK